jgi:hypothetical protein
MQSGEGRETARLAGSSWAASVDRPVVGSASGGLTNLSRPGLLLCDRADQYSWGVPPFDPRVSLASVLQSQPGVYALLIGSGVSTGAGIPIGWGVVEAVVRKVAVASGATVGDDFNAEAWWEANGEGELGYSSVLEKLGSTPGARRALLAGFFEPTQDDCGNAMKVPGEAHKAIAALVLTGNARTSRHWQAGHSPRKATDPVNALLNYAYALAEVECRIACVAVGLDPDLGLMHTDTKHRASMALDLIEAIRPNVERTVLELLRIRKFRSIDFIETPDGTCRLAESVTHSLTEAMSGWAAAIAPVAEKASHMIGATSRTRVRVRTPLTRSAHQEANRMRAEGSATMTRTPKQPAALVGALTMPACVDCGTPLTVSSRKRCRSCDALDKVERMIDRAALGRKVRASSFADPAQTAQTRQARIDGLTASKAARDASDGAHSVSEADRARYEQETLPRLVALPLGRIAEAIGVSIAPASLTRRGKLSPHARHWNTLASLVKSEPTT